MENLLKGRYTEHSWKPILAGVAVKCRANGALSESSIPCDLLHVLWRSLFVLPPVQNGGVNKFDPGSVERMLALDAAMEHHPAPGDGQLQRFSVFAEPEVMIGERKGQAVAYTRSYGLIRITEKRGVTTLEWHPAASIKRVNPIRT